MKKIYSLLLIIAITLVVFSCKRTEKTRWNIDGTAPIAHGVLTVADLMPDSVLQTDTNGILHFVMSKNLTDFAIDSLVSIPDTSFLDYYGNEFFSTPVDSGNSAFVIPIGIKESSMNFPSAELMEVVVTSGKIAYTLENFIEGEIKASYELPLVTKEGQTVYIEEILPPGTYTNPSIVSGEFDLTGFHFDLRGVDSDNHNIMVSDIIVLANEDLIVPSNDTIFKAIMAFTDAKVGYARGYFGQHEITINDTLDFEAINKIIDGNLGIGTIDVDLTVENFVGIDGQINFESLTAVNTNESTAIMLDNPGLGNTINLTRAQDNNGNIQSTFYSLNLNENNSNIDEFIEVLPNQLQTNIGININPLGDISLGNDFIYTNQPLEANLEIDLQLCVTMDNLTLVDTLEINTDSDLEANGNLTFYITNQFPFSAIVEAILLDENNETIETIIDNIEIGSGNYSALDNQVVGIEQIIQASYDNTVLNALNNNAKIALKIKLNSYDNTEVKFTPDNQIAIKVIGQGTTEISYD